MQNAKCKKRRTEYWVASFFALIVVLLSGCQEQSPDFQIVLQQQREIRENQSISVNNCDNPLPKLFPHIDAGGQASIWAENMIANGDEPFISIRKQIAALYGNNAERFFVLAVPPNTHRVFNFTTVSVEYRGLLTGSVVTANKIRPADDTTYGYRPLKDAFLVGHEDLPC